MIFGYILVAAVWVYIFYSSWYDSTDHWHKDKGIAGLYESAPIIEVTEIQTPSRTFRKIRTTVRFEDGFRYVSHKCCIRDFMFFREVSMTDELREEILADAHKAHQTEIALRDGTLS